MGHAEASTVIPAPAARVWEALNDIARTPEWVVGLERAEITTPGPYGPNSVYVDHNRLGPFPQTTAWRVAAFDPPRHQVHVSESRVLPSTMTLTLTPEGTGTRLHMAVDYRFLPALGPVSRLLESLVMNRMLSSVIAQNQAGLARYLARG